ncbi:MAG: PEP-CTERM sorting domain-containing protein [Phycisphaerae bacterium]
MRNARWAVLAASLVLAASAGWADSIGPVYQDSFSGGVFYPTFPNEFFGLRANGTPPWTTGHVDGWIRYNSNQINDGAYTSILVGEQFAAPGFDFRLNLAGNILTKANISGRFEGNHATIQFDEDGVYSGLFGNLDFEILDTWYRMQQSGFTWEIKQINPDTGTTELMPLLASGYWNYKQIDNRSFFLYHWPQLILTDPPSQISATSGPVTLDGSQSYQPNNEPFTALWKTSTGATISSQLLVEAQAWQFGFEHPGQTIDVELELTDHFLNFNSQSFKLKYINADPVLQSAWVEYDEENFTVEFLADAVDDDLSLNPYQPGFEQLLVEFLHGGTLIAVGGEQVSHQQLEQLLGGRGLFELTARVTDRAGRSDSTTMQLEVIPEPAAMLLLLAGAGILSRRRRPDQP